MASTALSTVQEDEPLGESGFPLWGTWVLAVHTDASHCSADVLRNEAIWPTEAHLLSQLLYMFVAQLTRP